VHSVGFAPADQLEGDYLDAVTREGFQIAHDISSYSFAALAKAGLPLMQGRNGALLTLTYLGSTRALAGYNVMGLAKASLEANVRYMARSLGPKGIRVNAISAGPIKTLAAAGIPHFRKMLRHVEETAPLRRTITPEGSRQRRRLPLLRPGLGRHRRNHLRGFRLQHPRHDRAGRVIARNCRSGFSRDWGSIPG
jgi:enoyl-[acyl-carrier protein] reductase I